MVDEKKESNLEKAIKSYKNLPKTNFKSLEDMPYLSGVELLKLKAQFERIDKEVDPTEKYKDLSRLYGSIKQDIAIYAGYEKNKGKEDQFKELFGDSSEGLLNAYASIGSQLVDKLMKQ